jgi:signal transduction histidine kinase
VAGDHGDPEKEELARQLGGLFPLAARSKQGIVQVLRSGRLDVLSGSDLAEQLALAPGQEEVICQLGCGSAMLTPLTTAAGPMGVITLVVAAPGRRFSPDEQALALDLGHRAALALENARLYEEARNAVRRRDEFLAMLAHELRNPLAPILSGAQLMGVLGLSDPRQERARASIERQGRHLARLLDDLLDLSRVNYDKIALRREAVDLGIVAGDAVQATRALLDERGHRLTLTLGATPLIVDGDPTRLAQVLSNLLQNAAKYTPPGGRIELTAAAEGDEAVVRVTDDGAGIAPEMLGRVFEPFAQLDASLDRSGGGLGIGLTLVRRLVELHGGRVSARSAGPGMGSTFEVRLPLGRPAESVEAKDATPTSGARRVLLVEDNADGRNMLADLMRQWGHTVEEAGDGFEGVERLKRQLPDVALVDVGLPGMDGYQLAAAVRETEGGDRVLLVAVTGYGQPEDRRRALAAGFDVHLVKPIDLMTLEMLLAGEK